MPHVLRDGDGRIMAVLDRPSPGRTEELAADEPELLVFLGMTATDHRALVRSDLEFIRVLEDVIEALIERRVILTTDLPPEARAKLMSRGRLRKALRGAHGLLDGAEPELSL